MKKTFCFLFTALLFLLSLTGCEQTVSEPLPQELPPQKGEDIAVMETSLGTTKLRFFPEQGAHGGGKFSHTRQRRIL